MKQPVNQDTRLETPPYDTARSPSSRPAKMRKTRRNEDVSDGTIVAAYGGTEASAANAHDAPDDETEDQTPETRSCENCRRCKLKCSRTKPCNKCVAKALPCVYEQPEKKRGPRPGYIEELYRRIDALEHMVLGQALMRRRDSRSPVHSTLREAVNHERDRLGNLDLELDHHGQHQQQQPPSLLGLPASQQPTPSSSIACHSLRALAADGHSISDRDLTPQVLHQLCDAFRHQIHPWMPTARPKDLASRIPNSVEHHAPLDPLLKAAVAAAWPFVMGAWTAENERRFDELLSASMTSLLRSADLDTLRVSLIAQFLLFGKGRIASHWGLVTYPAQVAIQAGLHLEDYHLSQEHRDYRLMVQLTDLGENSWAGKETMRRLFWVIFQQDHFAAFLAGTRPSFDVSTIRRLFPCDGQQWHDGSPVQTREFVPASVAIQVSVFADGNMGGFAFLLEATEIQANIIAFVRRPGNGMSLRQDIRGCLQEFLNLDLMLTNWKAKLPVRYQQASYDANGYMDHNITLAHLTHNLTTILLYQWPYTSWGATMAASDLPSNMFPQVLLVKQAAKEIAKISARFLLHRRYLMSPQFAFCQFTAARALLAYSHWMMEPRDEDFDTLFTSLGEAAKRWEGADMMSQGNDPEPAPPSSLASMLQARLAVDIKQPGAINLATPGLHLLRNMEWDDGSGSGSGSGYEASIGGVSSTTNRHRGADSMVDSSEGRAPAQLPAVASGGGDNDMGAMNPGSFMGTSDDFERAMSQLASNQTGELLDTRIFTWHDSPRIPATPPDPPLS